MRSRLTLALVVATPALGPAVTHAEPLDTREWSLRETAFDPLHDPVYEIERADLRFSWRADAVGATESSFLHGSSTTLATGSVGGELAISHAACDLFVAGGQADLRSGDSPLSFQQWASFCPLAGDVRITIEHHLAYDVRARLLAPPRQRPGDQRMETVTFDLAGFRERVNDPGPLSLAPPPAAWIALMAARTEVSVGWQASTPAPVTTIDLQATQEMYAFGYQKARADEGPPLDLWILGARALILTHDTGTMAQVATAARMDAFKLKDARLAGLRVGGDLGIAMGIASDGSDSRVGSMMTGVGAVTVERDVVQSTDAAITLSARVARDVWPLWDGRVVIDDRATLGYGQRRRKLRLRGEVSAARSHHLAHDSTLTSGNTGGLTTIAEYEVNRHLTVRSRNELGWSVYAAGATVDAPVRAVEAMVTAVVHTGSR